jgi:hypothetical protein
MAGSVAFPGLAMVALSPAWKTGETSPAGMISMLENPHPRNGIEPIIRRSPASPVQERGGMARVIAAASAF